MTQTYRFEGADQFRIGHRSAQEIEMSDGRLLSEVVPSYFDLLWKRENCLGPKDPGLFFVPKLRPAPQYARGPIPHDEMDVRRFLEKFRGAGRYLKAAALDHLKTREGDVPFWFRNQERVRAARFFAPTHDPSPSPNEKYLYTGNYPLAPLLNLRFKQYTEEDFEDQGIFAAEEEGGIIFQGVDAETNESGMIAPSGFVVGIMPKIDAELDEGKAILVSKGIFIYLHREDILRLATAYEWAISQIPEGLLGGGTGGPPLLSAQNA